MELDIWAAGFLLNGSSKISTVGDPLAGGAEATAPQGQFQGARRLLWESLQKIYQHYPKQKLKPMASGRLL